MQDTLDTLTAMRREEEVGYTSNDWTQMSSSSSHHCSSTSSSTCMTAPQHASLVVDRDCRTQMAAWCYQVVDACKLTHESVEITFNYLDRFLATAAGVTARSDRWAFQLACMGCLYTAVKIHEPQAMTPDLIARLSNGAYTAKDIEAMEVELLEALQWRVNPPTAYAFVRHMMDLLMPATPQQQQPQQLLLCLDNHTRQVVLDLTILQMELTVSKSLLVGTQASRIAYAALMNALESLGLETPALIQVGTFLAHSLHIQASSVQDIQDVMYQTVAAQQPNNNLLWRSNNNNNNNNNSGGGRRLSSLLLLQQQQQKDAMSVEISPRSAAVYSQ